MPTTETRTPTREADAGAPPTAGACPRCGAPLNAPVAWCPGCRLDLTGPPAAELSDLNLRHQALCHRRAETLRALDGELAAIAERRHQVLSALGRQEAGATGTAHPGPPSGGRGATNGWGTQMLLLALGVLCLTIAAAVFAAVGWDRLNQWGQAGVLIAATVAAGVGGVVLFRRGLRATGEAVLALGTVMVLVDIATFGSALGAGTGDLRFWSGGLAVLAVLGAVSRRFGPLTGGVVAAIAAQAPLPLAVFAALGNPSATGFDLTLWNPDPTQPGIAAASVMLIVQALAAALGAREFSPPWSSPVVVAGLTTASVGWLAAVGLSLAISEPTALAAILVGAGVVAAIAATIERLDRFGAATLAGAAAACFLGGWLVLASAHASPTIWITAGAVLTLVASRPLTGRYRAGPTVVAGVALTGAGWVLIAATAFALERFGDALGGIPAGLLPDGYSWVDVGVVAVASARAIASGGRGGATATSTITRRVLPTGTALAAYLVAVGPPLLGTSTGVWAAALAVAAAASAALAVATRPGTPEWTMGWAAAAATAPASFLLAHQTPAAALAGLIIVVVGSASTLAWLGRAGRVGEAVALGLVAAATAVLTAGYVAWMARADDAWIAVGAAATAAVIALGASFIVANSGPPAWAAGRWKRAALGLSPAWFGEVAAPVIGLVLAMQGVATVWAVGGAIETDVAAPGAVALTVGAASWFAVAAIANQRWAAAVGAVHAQCTSWLLLATAGVRILEAYTLPGAFVLLVIGAWWLTDSHSTSSWSALGPALGMGLGPSTLAALADQGPRALWVIGSAALVVAVGALTRLAAPVVFGAVCLGTLAIIELAPLVGGLPRYLTFGVAGALLLLLGATFEQRRADLAALNRQLRSLR